MSYFQRNIQILRNAIGKEPISQILANAIRKIIGLEPIVNEGKKLEYKDYLKIRNTVLANKKLKPNYRNTMSAIIVDNQPNDSFNNIAYQSLLTQRVSPDQIKLVSQNRVKSLGKLQVFKSLGEVIPKITSDYIVITQSDHRIHPCFIQEVMLFLEANDVDLLHTFYDFIQNGERHGPQWVPPLNQYLLYSYNYIGNLIVIKKSFGDQLNWFSTHQFLKFYLYDFILRAIDFGASFYCLPDILYTQVTKKEIVKNEEQKIILKDHLQRNDWKGEIVEGKVPYTMRIKWSFSSSSLVSIIIPFRDKVDLLYSCVESILHKTDYDNYEIILADNRSQKSETETYIQKLVKEQRHVTRVKVDMDFNFSAINNYAVSKCKGEFILFLNNDTKVINRSWLSEMVMEMNGPNVGVVGAKLLYEDDTVQHAGVIYGIGDVADHAFRHIHDEDSGHMDRANLVQEYLAVTGACLLTKKTIFAKVGGFDAINLAITYNDVDLCFKIIKLGLKVIYTPYARLYHYESKSRESDLEKSQKIRYNMECKFINSKWKKRVGNKKNIDFFLDARFETIFFNAKKKTIKNIFPPVCRF